VPVSPESVVGSIANILLHDSGLNEKRKKARAYHRLLSGFTRARYHGQPLRFMTLTTATGGSQEKLTRHFQTLRKRIKRAFGFKAEYWKINTSEGNGVLHIVYKGGFIPQSWLSNAWRQIHGAFIADIHLLKGKDKRIVNYLVSQYLCKQPFERMSWSWNWVFRGFCGVWKRQFSFWYMDNRIKCLKAWNKLICSHPSYLPGVQLSFGG
jgi:hypothetical protein